MNSKREVTQLVNHYTPQLKAFIRKRVVNDEDAEDILQDVFYQLAKKVTDMLNPIENVTAWLYRVTRNNIINKGEKKREQELPLFRSNEDDDEVIEEFADILFSTSGQASPSPEAEYLRSLVWSELESALEELPPEQREIFELTELDGLPVKEISEAKGIPVNTLLSRKHYAVKHLRKRLEEMYYDFLE